MNRIRITYYGEDAPKIEADKTDLERIELIDGEEARWLFLKHGEVSVYHTERHQDVFSDNWYSTIRGQESDAEEAFEVWCLPAVPDDLQPRFEALFPNDEQRQTVAHAIEAGLITEDGYQS